MVFKSKKTKDPVQIPVAMYIYGVKKDHSSVLQHL